MTYPNTCPECFFYLSFGANRSLGVAALLGVGLILSGSALQNNDSHVLPHCLML